ncbi:MAG: hypothetical protein KA586_00965 [Candidatus Promineofilum sp.]|nr:hypothetical protein [Promineifilum sp.]
MKQTIAFLGFIALLIVAWASMMGSPAITPGNAPQQEVPSLPRVEYLGEAGGPLTINPDHTFVIKYRRNDYKELPGPNYTAKAGERVWDFEFTPGGEVILYGEGVSFGPSQIGCVIDYVQIDDDVDDRINHFYVNGALVHTVPQGMVTYGSFVMPEDGEITFFANDSVGLAITICGNQTTSTPTMTPTVTETSTATPTATATMTATLTMTPTVTLTSTLTATPTSTSTPTATSTGTITATPTGTMTETATPTATTEITPTATMTPSFTPTMTQTPTPTVKPPPGPFEGTATPTPTRPARLDSCLRIDFEMGPDVARRGTFVVQETGGRVLATWWADEGWTDSGWIQDLDISHPSVHVQVFFVQGDGSPPIEMTILNPAPDTSYGWLTRGRCHALEVAWPG